MWRLYNPVNKIQEKYFRNLTQLSKNRGLPAWRGCFRSPDNGIFVSLRQGLMGEAGKTQGSSFLTVFFWIMWRMKIWPFWPFGCSIFGKNPDNTAATFDNKDGIYPETLLNKKSAIEGVYILRNGYHCDITTFYITSLLWNYVVRKYIQCPFFLINWYFFQISCRKQ